MFDAYLLGFCDDVTRALAKQLFRKSDMQETIDRNRRRLGPVPGDYGGKSLLSVLQDGDDYYDVKDWSSVTVPAERVLLFPGALASTDDTSELTYLEIAHCDGCSRRIRGLIKKCAVCFDYDLCSKCFPSLSKSHYGGKHAFNSEPAAR